MYFWNIDKLKKELRKGPISESESFKYVFANTIIFSLTLIPVMETNIWDVYYFILTGIITVAGVYYIYQCNKGASGENFLQRSFSIGWVAAIRWIVQVLLPTTIAFYVLVALFSTIEESTTLSEVVFFNLIYVTYFWQLGNHIKEVAR